jgi:mono/diheme cytochrome c family protein
MHRLMPAIFFLALMGLAVGAAVANSQKADKAAPKDLYKGYCRTCHGPKGPAKELTPMTLIQEQWERFFKEKYQDSHSAIKDPAHGDKPVTEAVPKEDLEKIRKFLVDHAADSEQPSTCG